MTEVIREVLPDHRAGALTGPNLAREIMAGFAAASVVAFDDVDFTEYYDTAADPWQLSNLAEKADTAAARAKLHTRLHEWFGCAGDACR